MKSLFKIESLIMTLIVIFYGFIAGGSAESGTFWVIMLVAIGIAIIVGSINVSISAENKKKRLEIKKEFESKETEFDMSDKIGNDRIGLYFDKSKEKVLITSIKNGGIEKFHIDDFKKQIVKGSNNSYCAIDTNRKKILFVQSEGNFSYKVIEYTNDCNKNEDVNNNIPIQLYAATLQKECFEPKISPTFILLEEKYGYITVFKDISAKSFNYISKEYIIEKKGETSFVSKKQIGSYIFLMDDFYKVLVIISPLIYSHKIVNYADIINVTYEEDGNTLFTKSLTRTVGGALVGGALMGGAGTIVGGLSGNTSMNKEVKSMKIKILVRNTTTPSINLPINLRNETFNTKNESSKRTYQKRIKEANNIKDLISVIIDNTNQQSTNIQINEEPKQKSGIADELAKLAQLKDAGILSEEEFQEQKRKLLN